MVGTEVKKELCGLCGVKRVHLLYVSLAKSKQHGSAMRVCWILTINSYTTGFCSIASGVMPVPTIVLPLASLASTGAVAIVVRLP